MLNYFSQSPLSGIALRGRNLSPEETGIDIPDEDSLLIIANYPHGTFRRSFSIATRTVN